MKYADKNTLSSLVIDVNCSIWQEDKGELNAHWLEEFKDISQKRKSDYRLDVLGLATKMEQVRVCVGCWIFMDDDDDGGLQLCEFV